MSDWLKNLKVGDEVAVSWMRETYIYRIERETPALLILSSGCKVRKSDGRITPRPTGYWSAREIQPVTQEIRDAVETNNMKKRLEKTDARLLSLDQLRRIVAILDEPRKDGEA